MFINQIDTFIFSAPIPVLVREPIDPSIHRELNNKHPANQSS